MSRLTRRRFLQVSAGAGVGMMAAGRTLGSAKALPAPSLLDPLTQPLFVNQLPNPMNPAFSFDPIDTRTPNAYRIGIHQFSQDLGLRSPGGASLKTTVWGYGTATQAPTYPGRTIFAESGEEITVEWPNNLVDAAGPVPHLLPVDSTLHWADPFGDGHLQGPYTGPVPVVTHVHGGHTHYLSDGLPDAWYTPGYTKTGRLFNRTYTYENDQEAGTVWYHDHALGITRLNVYAGLAGFFIIRDEVDTGEADNPLGLPAFPYEIALAVQDRMFASDGSLYYPTTPMVKGAPDPSVLPEFFGDFILVNGQAWPKTDVEPRKYRLRVLNGSDSRFYTMQWKAKGGPGSQVPTYVIGTDLGLLDAPVELKGALVIGPGERYDVIVDFAGFAGKRVVITNNAPTPYPVGAPSTPTVGQLMAFDVNLPLSDAPDQPLPSNLRTTPFGVGGTVAQTRQLVLFEGTDMYGRIEAFLGPAAVGGLAWDVAPTETVALDTVEEWEFYNTTPDAHPIHIHLPHFEVVGRNAFKAQQNRTTGALRKITLGAAVPIPTHWNGPKDTVQVFPGEMTRVRARFDRTGEYVWHCHILSHEDHEMMRPYTIG